MQEDEDMSEPFWLQTADGHRRLRRRRQLSSIFLNSGLLLTLLLVIAALLIFLIIPSFLSFTSQILRPHSVKKSWDSLNLLLVLFAILCGFLSRNGVQRSNNGSGSYEPAASAARTAVSTSYYDDHRRFQQSPVAEKISLLSSPQRRFGYERYQDRLSHSAGGRGGGGGGMSRLRSFNSYPDLRQESLWNGGASSGGDDRWRFYDDTHLRDYSYRFPSSSSDEILPHREVGKEEEMAVAEVKENEMEKEIVVDTLTVAKQEVKDEEVIAAADPPPPLLPVDLPLPAPSSPQLLPPTKVAKRRVQRTYQSVGQSRSSDGGEEREMDIEDFYKRPLPSMSSRSPPQKPVSRRRVKRNINRPEFVESIREEEDRTAVEEIKYVFLPPPSPPPPPPPPPPEKKKKSKDFLISLRRKKKKKQRQNSVENLASLFDPEHDFPATQSESSIPPPSPLPPPPPPPPPPQHFLQNLFSPRRGKSKKVHSVSLAPPPPPPPPPRRAADSTELHLSRNVRRSMEHPSVSRAKLERAPATAYRISNREETGSASPLIPIPPPPPPPPFKMPAWRFEVRGDYVRVASFNSSRSGSPDLESEDPSDRESSPMAGSRESPAAAGSPLFCPSPDVDTKADNFIARFRAGLKLEKVRSNLGPGAGEGPI